MQRSVPVERSEVVVGRHRLIARDEPVGEPAPEPMNHTAERTWCVKRWVGEEQRGEGNVLHRWRTRRRGPVDHDDRAALVDEQVERMEVAVTDDRRAGPRLVDDGRDSDWNL